MFKIVWLMMLVLQISAYKSTAQDSNVIDSLIQQIAAMQLSGDEQFHPGMYYSYKKYAGYPQRYTPDNNIFFTGIIAFALKNMLPHLSEKNQQIASQIINKATTAFPFYQNERGQPSYYFWQGGKPIMPNTYFVQYTSEIFATSEDVDDSVMLLMAMNAPDSIARQLKSIIDSAANGRRRYVNNTFKKYRKIPAHTTYVGSKMRVDFDFAVQCNVLYFVLENKLPLNKYDSATLNLLKDMIVGRHYTKHPHYVASYYINPPVILYHLARLMGKFNPGILAPYRHQIINDIKQQLVKSQNIMDDIMLSTSLLRLGDKPEQLPIKSIMQFNASNQNQFVFYQARAGSQFPDPVKSVLINFSMLNYHFYCPAYNKVLLLEYLVNAKL